VKTAAQWLRDAARRLKAAGIETARLDAELLLMHAWGCSRVQLIQRSQDALPDDVKTEAGRLLARRLEREPLAYITGEREFWSRSFRVGRDALIPRPETEHLIEAVLERFPDRDRPWRFCDIGTGSGCIAVTLACEYPQANVVATDISAPALALARQNAERHQVLHRIDFLEGDLLQPLGKRRFDAIVSNPPYVAAEEMLILEPELSHEPRTALTDEADGLRLLKALVSDAPDHLKSGGWLIVETGPCGLPPETGTMALETTLTDLAGRLRGGVYRRA